MQTQLVILALLFILFTTSAYLILSRKFNFRLKLLTLILFSGTAVLYIRTGFGRYFTTIDESYYVSLLGNPLWYRTAIVSGYMTPFSLRFVHSIFHNIIHMIIGYSIVMSILYVITLFIIYLKSGVSKNRALLAILMLFTTPLYLWSVIQIRPQQIGLLVGLSLALLIVKGRPTIRNFGGIFILYLALIFAHVLSFILYSVVFIMYLSLLIILDKHSSEIIKKYIIVAVSIMASWIVFVAFPYSESLLNNIRWIVNSVLDLHMSVQTFYVVSILVIGMFISIAYLGPRYLGNHYPTYLSSLKSYFLNIANAETKVAHKRYLPWILVGITILAVFYVQFELGTRMYTRVYNNSVVAVVFFQMGNLFFALFFLRGLFMKLREKTMTNFDILSVMWIPLGAALLIISFFMPKGSGIWGFHNWLIRTLQYFVVFASPIAAYPIMQDIPSGNPIRIKSVISFLVGILVVISVLNTVRIPSIYSYDVVWTQELVDICQDSPVPAIYVPRIKESVYSLFSISDLLGAHGGSLREKKPKTPTYLVLSSDRFYVYAPEYRSISLGAFESRVQSAGVIPWAITGDNMKLWRYLPLLGNVIPIPTGRGKDCPLVNNIISPPTILIGGRAVNPCTFQLEKEHVVPVYLDSYSVRTPNDIYTTSRPNPWWNAREGLFVIQTVEYHNTPVLIIEGTNADATLAAVYYFTEEIYPNLLSKYKDTKYIVGKWAETDNTVISIAKLAPHDINGFSLGDKITILEKE